MSRHALFIALAATLASAPRLATALQGATQTPVAADRITMADYKKLAASGKVVTIDVRGAAEYGAGHITGALSMPLSSLNESAATKLKAMGKVVVAYCA